MKLKITGLSRTYQNGVKALEDVSLEIGEGMFGLLGPNGAGKSTLMRTIATIQLPDKGKIMLDDIDVINDPMSLRKVLGYLPQEFGVYPKISAADLLEYFAALKGISPASERTKAVKNVLEAVNLFEERNKYVAGYSGGMKRRVNIGVGLLHKPRLLFMDEPTVGIDIQSRTAIWVLLEEINKAGTTIVYTSHHLEEAARLCSRVVIMDQGRIVGEVTDTKGHGGTERLEEVFLGLTGMEYRDH